MNNRAPISSSTATPEKRGTIIVDSSALFYLSLPANWQFLGKDQQETNDAPRYSDLLILLSQHGYDIVFPEMVAYECADTFSNGQNLGALFSNEDPSAIHQRTRTFLTQVGEGKYPHMHILPAPAKASSKAQKFMYDVHHLFDSERLSDVEKRGALTRLNEQHARQGFGEIAIADLVHHTRLEQPITYLSNDRKSFSTVARAMPDDILLGRLTLPGFLQALQSSGVLQRLGITTKNPVLSIIDNIRTKTEQLGENAMLLETIDGNGQPWKNTRPFFGSLVGLRKELEVGSSATTITEPSADAPGKPAGFLDKLKDRLRLSDAPNPRGIRQI